MNYTELHFHLLPGVDDGPATISESIDLARAAAAEGTRTIATTPHVMEGLVTDTLSLPGRVAELSKALRGADVPVDVLCGGELAHPMAFRLSHRELDVIAQGPAGHRWLLLEAPLKGLEPGFAAAAAALRGQGFGIVIAHPERAAAATPERWQMIEAEVEAGCGVQVNVWSLAGHYGEVAREFAIRAIRSSPVAVLSSDAHGSERPPSMQLGVGMLRGLGVPQPEWLTEVTPRALLERGLPASVIAARAA